MKLSAVQSGVERVRGFTTPVHECCPAVFRFGLEVTLKGCRAECSQKRLEGLRARVCFFSAGQMLEVNLSLFAQSGLLLR